MLGRRDRQLADIHDRFVLDGDRQVLRLQSLALADRARLRAHQPLDLGADELGLGLPMAPLEIRDDPFVGGLVPAALAFAVVVLHAQGIAVIAIQDDLPIFDGQPTERLVHRNLVATGHRFDQVVVEVG